MLKRERISVLYNFDLLQFYLLLLFAYIFSFWQIWVLFVHHEVVLKLFDLQTLLLNPHEIRVQRKNQQAESKKEAWWLKTKFNEDERSEWGEETTCAHPWTKSYDHFLGYRLDVAYYGSRT